jgi:hypothetical protein
MYHKTLISLTALCITALAAGNVSAQEASPQKSTVGPALEFTGGGTAFGIQGKIPVIPNFSVRPSVLFGYQADVNIPVNLTTQGSTFNNTVCSPPGINAGFAVSNPCNTSPNTVGGSTTRINVVPSGTAYGLAITYDFIFSNSKLSGYVGPRLLFVSASGDAGGSVKVTANQTNIGLLAGIDYQISDRFTAGLNAIYDFSRSGSYTITGSNNGFDGTRSISSSGFNVGINLGYSF